MRHLSFFLLFLCVCVPCVHAQENEYRPNILFLNSYHQGYIWSDRILAGISDVFAQEKKEVSIHIEYMGTKHHNSPAYNEKLRSLYAYKYKKLHFDLILASDDNAVKFLIKYKNALFSKTPVIFCGVNDPATLHTANKLGMIGIFEEWNAKETVDLALKFFPQTEHLAVIADTTTTGKAGKARIRRIEPEYGDKLEFIYIDTLSIQGTQKALQDLPENTVVLYTVFFTTEDNREISIQQAHQIITRSTSAPIFVTTDFNVLPGVIGGSVVSGYYQGKAAAHIASDLLLQKQLQDTIQKRQTIRTTMFDYTGLHRFNIHHSKLPADSIILNQPTSAYITYKSWIWLIICFFLFETSLIFVFAINRAYRKKIQQELAAGKERLDLAIRGTEQGLFYWDILTDRITFTYFWKEILGHHTSVPAATLKEWEQQIHPDDLPALIKARNNHLQGKTPLYEKEFRARTAQGTWCWLRVRAKIVQRHEDGSPKEVAAILHNITSRKQAEAEQLRLISALEQSDEAIAITETDGNILYINPSFAAFHKVNPEEVLHAPIRNIAQIFKQKKLWEHLKENTNWREHIHSTFEHGNVSDLEFRAFVIRDPRGARISYIFTHRDITREITLENQLRQSQKMEAIGQLAGGIAHDFNNLLQVILGYTNKIIEDDHLNTDDARRLQKISNASKRAASLVRQLLIFSRRDISTTELIDLNELIEDVLTLLKRTLGEQITISFTQSSTPPLVSADAGQIHQIIMNLCVNARDAMPEGGSIIITTEHVHLDTHFVRKNPWAHTGTFVRIVLQDTGAGMPPEIQEHIFEPFFTTKETGKGTGLGLATVYGIVKKHGGMIHVISTQGKGTSISIYLPGAKAKKHPALSAQKDSVHTAGTATLLVAEDDELVRSLTEEILEDAGYTVISASDGVEALEKFRDHHKSIDMVMLDVIMPGKTGQQVWEEVQRIRPDLPVLFSSGYSFNELKDNVLISKTGHLIQKPYTPKNLLETIARMLDQSTA